MRSVLRIARREREGRGAALGARHESPGESWTLSCLLYIVRSRLYGILHARAVKAPPAGFSRMVGADGGGSVGKGGVGFVLRVVEVVGARSCGGAPRGCLGGS